MAATSISNSYSHPLPIPWFESQTHSSIVLHIINH